MFKLMNAEKRHAECPDTFEIPGEFERSHMAPGDLVKLVFEVEGYMPERMWVQVQNRGVVDDNVIYQGALANEPAMIPVGSSAADPANHPLKLDMAISFRPEHIICLTKSPERWFSPDPKFVIC